MSTQFNDYIKEMHEEIRILTTMVHNYERLQEIRYENLTLQGELILEKLDETKLTSIKDKKLKQDMPFWEDETMRKYRLRIKKRKEEENEN